jgi:ABC-2 type transport system ATP-binding protein
MKKKLDLACGLIHQPELILLDEPSLGLDVPVRRDLWSYMLGLKERGVTLLLCTNSMEEAERLCDEVAIIDRGGLAVTGSPAQLKNRLKKDMISLEVAPSHEDHGEKRDILIHALSQLSRVKSIVKNGAQVKIYVESNETALPEILQCAATVSVEIDTITYSRPGLDEVFLQYTGRPWTEEQKTHG